MRVLFQRISSSLQSISNNIHIKPLIHGSLLRNILFATLGTSFILFVLFQKKLLPKPVAKVVSKVLFYPTFPFTAALRYGNYWTEMDDTVILGCAPMGFMGHPREMAKLGVKGVVNMCYEYSGPQTYYAQHGIRQLRLPVIDHTEPSVEYMKEAVSFIQRYKDKGEKVYVHCKAGHGRAAAVTMSWLMHSNPHMTPQVLHYHHGNIFTYVSIRGLKFQFFKTV